MKSINKYLKSEDKIHNFILLDSIDHIDFKYLLFNLSKEQINDNNSFFLKQKNYFIEEVNPFINNYLILQINVIF